ncbi:MAG: SDR family NAD(P)-dependent oxidoreductase [Gammaproteobacteria bacterium]|nr:SDR family NAD(P)-dependent oxidoreductase [Gammaproteobacteria bacterium]
MQKTILITGCSSGIGLCAAETLQKRGYRVFATARKESDVAKLREKGFDSFMLDMDNSDSIRQALAQVLAQTGGTLDALFNNAGYAIPGAIEDLSRDLLRQQFETNVFGPMELINLVLPIMRKQGHGRIIQNTSILGIVAIPYRGAYNASKFALEGFTNTLRQELRKTNLSVSIIAPGPISSQFRENARKNYEETLKEKESLHKTRYQKMEETLTNTSASEKKLTLQPDAVVAKLIHALESPHPKARYYVGLPAHLFALLRRLLPDYALDWIINKSMKESND